MELKNELVKSFQKLLIDNRIQQFEHDLSKRFYSHSFASLNVNSSYTDWLLHWYRIRSGPQKLNGLITTYLNIESPIFSNNKKLIFHFLRILSFVRNQENIKQTFEIEDDSQTFYVIKFRLVDFLRFIKFNEKNHRQRTNMVEIFKEFEYLHNFKLKRFPTILDESLILNDTEFSSVVMIPFFKIKKKRMYGILSCLSQTNFMSTISLFSLTIIF